MIKEEAKKIKNKDVSILVFVELALDVHGRSGERHPQDVSILVFVELALDDIPKVALA